LRNIEKVKSVPKGDPSDKMKSAKLQFKVKNLINPFVIIVFAVVLRLLPHPPNVAPIAAMALFGGVYLNKKYALIVPLVALFISDLFIGFYSSMAYVYFSFLLTGMIGIWLRRHKSFTNIILASLVSSTFFFLITNFGFFLTNDLYPKTLNGQLEAYIMALPFFRNTLLGDLGFVGLFFGGYELVLLLTSNRKAQMSKLHLKSKNF
jgi:hypothetical protein